MSRWTAVIAVAVLAGCGGENPGGVQPSPSPSATATPGLPGVTVGAATGPTAITLVAAEPLPAATLGGCGATAAGCVGRIRMTFALRPTGSGPVLWSIGFLHASNKTACLQGRSGALTLRAGEVQTVEIVFDQAGSADRCGTPTDITDLAFNVEGTVEVASRQEWGLRYTLAP